ncbi:hypothetical protein NR800_33225 [Corallococcus interemptor]|uniref:hypothetical protein n=1 Tax=Corallococcus TaxID=83461 RepID=UPI001A8FEE11|nr:hypothetical protein [Corallococcus sp. NCRR]MBN9688169.1 hypothetical protein [Corallococcus sp. NCSPR001]MBZ4332033.1 hypothetical protein [Corallococcus sp. AS-1-12]MBZ4373032.1 hypothetical protein [Corallococcus sp. AS-1-6]WAS88025.1 hypothetical protein O0N60_13830 [Corallococcus sp. NCRR]
MSITPCPIPLPSALRDEETVDDQRNLFCPNYDACLHQVVKKGWEGWSCRGCDLRHFRVGQPTAQQFAVARPGGWDGQ